MLCGSQQTFFFAAVSSDEVTKTKTFWSERAVALLFVVGVVVGVVVVVVDVVDVDGVDGVVDGVADGVVDGVVVVVAVVSC